MSNGGCEWRAGDGCLGDMEECRRKRQRGCEQQRGAIGDLPAPLLSSIFGFVPDVRNRNAMSLVCREWHQLERATRVELCLRGNVSDLHMLPSGFTAVERLDMSNCSPWGYSAFHQQAGPQLAAEWLRRAFPLVRDLCIYVRDTVDIAAAAWTWPGLETLRLVRWHQRAMHPEEGAAPGMELCGLLSACPRLLHLDLSRFYCWTEDVAPALQLPPGVAAGLQRLNLLKLSPEGFKAPELANIATACPSLDELKVVCDFDPRFLDCVDDACLLQLASSCASLRLLHLVDTSQFPHGRIGGPDGEPVQEARLTVEGLADAFKLLPKLEEVALLLGQALRDSAPALEALAKHAVHIRSLDVSHFHGLWRKLPQGDGAPGGIAACSSLEVLRVKMSDDLCDEGLRMIATGCPMLSRIGLRSCDRVSEEGLASCASLLRQTLAHVEIGGCHQLPTAAVLRALSPLRRSLRYLHVDCLWEEGEESEEECRDEWPSLLQLSLWAPAELLLSSFPGLKCCPLLDEVIIRVEGDCRSLSKPQSREWGLGSLRRFPSLSRLRLDLSDVVGYALSAPGGSRDLSIWERFYLNGIQSLNLYALDYSPPSDREVNCRGIALPGVGLLSLCSTLRQLFVHGTAYEHLFMMLLKIPNLRDVQLREDYYPTPETESCTEMRIDSCRRFENILEQRGYPD